MEKKNDPETFSLISYAHCWSFLVNFLFWYVNQYSFNWRIKRENWPKSFIRYFYYRGRQGPARAGSPFLYHSNFLIVLTLRLYLIPVSRDCYHRGRQGPSPCWQSGGRCLARSRCRIYWRRWGQRPTPRVTGTRCYYKGPLEQTGGLIKHVGK